jgi:hypothetical protein
MDNFERAANARKALDAGPYEALEDTLDYTIPTPDGEEAPGVQAYPISDLIADLFHLAAQNHVPIEPLVEEAMEHFGCDIVEQAWENNEEWHNKMQDSSNLERVNDMLAMHNIPAVYWPAIYIKLGMESD